MADKVLDAAMAVAVAVVVAVVPRVHAAMRARAVVENKRPARRVHEVHRDKAGKVQGVPVHPSATRNHVAMKAVLPVAAWASHALPAPPPVVSLTPCAPVSI